MGLQWCTGRLIQVGKFMSVGVLLVTRMRADMNALQVAIESGSQNALLEMFAWIKELEKKNTPEAK
jgi:hypothetical protein